MNQKIKSRARKEAELILDTYKQVLCRFTCNPLSTDQENAQAVFEAAKECAKMAIDKVILTQNAGCFECGGGDKEYYEQVLAELESIDSNDEYTLPSPHRVPKPVMGKDLKGHPVVRVTGTGWEFIFDQHLEDYGAVSLVPKSEDHPYGVTLKGFVLLKDDTMFDILHSTSVTPPSPPRWCSILYPNSDLNNFFED